MTDRGRWRLACGVAGLILAVMFALIGTDLRYSEYVWSPANGDSSGSFVLSRGWPDTLEVTARCDALHRAEDGTFFSAGGVHLSKLAGAVNLDSPGYLVEPLTLQVPDGPCTLTAVLDAESRTVSLRADDVMTSASIDGSFLPLVDRLEVPAGRSAEPVVESVRVVTQPWGVRHPPLRAIAGLLAVGLSIAALSVGRGRDRHGVLSGARHRIRVSRSGLGIGLVFVGAALLVPAFDDDGWVINSVRLFSQTGILSNLYSLLDGWLPQGNLHELTFWLLDHLGFPFIGLRLFVVGLLVVTWEILRRTVLPALMACDRRSIAFSASLFACFGAVWLVSIRAEAWVSLFCVLAWAGLVQVRRNRIEVGLFLALTGSGLALSTHQTGLTALPPAVWALCIVVSRLYRRRVSLVDVVLPIVSSSTIVIVGTFLLFGPDVALASARLISESPTHSYSIFSENLRYLYLFRQSSGGRLASVLILGVVLLAALSRVAASRSRDLYRLCFVAVLSLGMLTLTSSKWQWHFGAYAIPAAILGALALAPDMNHRRSRLPMFSVLLPALGVVTAIALSKKTHWGGFDLLSSTWGDFAGRFGWRSNVTIWIVLLLVMVLVGVLADYSRLRHVPALAATLAVVATLAAPGLSFAWIGRDAALTNGWSYPKQNLMALVGKDICSNWNFLTGFNALRISSTVNALGPRLVSDAFPKSETLKTLPVSAPQQSWGSWSAALSENVGKARARTRVAAVGTFFTPTFDVADFKSVGVWLATGDSSRVSFRVEFLDNTSASVAEKDIQIGSNSEWKSRVLVVPVGSAAARIAVVDGSDGPGGWGAVTTIAGAEVHSGWEVQQMGDVYMGPTESPIYSCLRLSPPSGGLWPTYEFVVGEAGLFSYVFGDKIELSAENCAYRQFKCLLRPKYSSATIHRRDMVR